MAKKKKYKVGDMVQVKSGLIYGHYVGGKYITKKMALLSKTSAMVEIKYVWGDGTLYQIAETRTWWNGDVFKGIANKYKVEFVEK